MILNKQQEKEVRDVVDSYWKNYIKGDVKGIASLLDQHYTQVGSAETEVFFNKKDAVKFLHDTIDQVAGKLEMRNHTTKVDPLEDFILVSDLCDLYALHENKWMFYSKFRASSLLQKKNGSWKIVHQHSSVPDAKTGEGENVSIEAIAAENQQLKEAVRRRTIELESKNRELEIEAALERVRAVSMGMKNPGDMIEICRTISKQLQILNVQNIRNVQTAIIDETKDTYCNYEYFTQYEKTSALEIEIGAHHPKVKEFTDTIKSSPDAFFTTTISEKELKGWRDFRKETGQIEDPILDKAKSLHYYFYSIGQGALGISAYSPLSEEEIKIFHRFRNVFNLAYQRFVDIQKAEAQAREAKIEVALEKVRARTMAMQKSDELGNVAAILFKELNGLVTNLWTCGFVLCEKNRDEDEWWLCTEGGFIPSFYLPNVGDITHANIYHGWLNGEDYHTEQLEGKLLQEHYDWLMNLEASKKVFEELSAAGFEKPKWQKLHCAYFSKGYLCIITRQPCDEEEIFKRFAQVFDLTYTRFLDLQKAEAQAKEAQVQVSLERVRASAMAMHKSEELPDVCETMYKEFLSLGFTEIRNAIINIYNDTDSSFINYDYADEVGKSSHRFTNDILPFVDKIIETSKSADDAFSESYIDGKALTEFKSLRKQTGQKEDPRLKSAESLYFYFYSIGTGSIGISTFSKITDEKIILLKRFRNVFNLSYQRYIDISNAEDQARESQIQLALERVRAKTMAMQHSNDLLDSAILLFEQMKVLGIDTGSCGFNIWDKNEKTTTVWMSSSTGGLQLPFKMPHVESPIYKEVFDEMKKGEVFLVKEVSGKTLEKHFDYLLTLPVIGDVIKQLKETSFEFPKSMVYHFAFFNNGYLSFHLHEPHPETHEIFKRFAKVFEQTYTRFLDLQQAETQARESQIEASLERVRARAMAMHKTDELQDAAELLYRELTGLGISSMAVTYSIMDVQQKNAFYYSINPVDGKIGLIPFELPHETDVMRKILSSWKKQDLILRIELNEEETLRHQTFIAEFIRDFIIKHKIDMPFSVDAFLAVSPKKAKIFTFNFTQGYIFFIGSEKLTTEQEHIMLRFTKVFELTYQRFLELSQAEMQTREAKIEASLERVRSRAMAMHKSLDLTEAAATVFSELNKLGIHALRSGFVLLDKNSRRAKLYPATSLDNQSTITYTGEFDFIGHPVFEKQYETWEKQENYFPILEGELLKSYYKILSKALEIPNEELPVDKKQYGSFLPFSEGFLFTWSSIPHTVESVNILNRFKSILDLTTRRYLDLQKAEAQTREAQIEASLERVRSKTMAMHNSQDVAETVVTMFDEWAKLGIKTFRCGIGILEENKQMEVWTARQGNDGKVVLVFGHIDMQLHPLLQGAYDGWKNKEESFSYELKGNDIEKYFNAINNHPDYPVKYEISNLPTRIFHKDFYFPEGTLYVFSLEDLPIETSKILKRFAGVLGQTYRRFLDLQRAEAQTREAHIEAGLERVRSRTLAMHSSSELAETAAVVFKQLMLLGIAPNRLFIGIMKDDEANAEFWITDEDGSKVSSAFATDLTLNQSFKKMQSGWKEQKKSITIDMVGKELEEYLQHLVKLNVPFKGGLSQKHRVQTIAFFSKGFIGIASPDSQPEETTLLLERFANVFNLTFTRFNDLQIAEEQARKAIVEEQKLREEKKRADILLLNILPEQIANELKEFGKSYARKHENVTILFADIKGFSSIAETLSAEELVTQLDECFRAFDKIVDKHGLEKIKTVGDAYVCACGLPNPVEDHAAKTVAAALDMNEFIKGFAMTKRIQDLPAFIFRIGIHTGPVVTGVVGLKKFTYDLWGDAVNLAARMEQHGEAGKINISGKTFELVKDKFNCLHRGKIEAKNKGEIDMYFVEGVI